MADDLIIQKIILRIGFGFPVGLVLFPLFSNAAAFAFGEAVLVANDKGFGFDDFESAVFIVHIFFAAITKPTFAIEYASHVIVQPYWPDLK